jgi:hypothetical protein
VSSDLEYMEVGRHRSRVTKDHGCMKSIFGLGEGKGINSTLMQVQGLKKEGILQSPVVVRKS